MYNSANFVARKIDDGIYKIEKDRKGHCSGSIYINTQQVIDVLNNELKVIIYDKDESKIKNTTVKGYYKGIDLDSLTHDELLEILKKEFCKECTPYFVGYHSPFFKI